jgi:hypothetical protein
VNGERETEGRWRRFGSALPMRAALVAVAMVWVLGCVWSFQEQSAFAASKGFLFPHLLPLVIDGFAVSMAGVSWAASLDARPAIPARLATVIAVGASSASNGVWAYLRAHHNLTTVVLGVAVPIAANLAFEVLLAELRRQVQRRRGLPAPVAVPYPRLIRVALAPWQTFRTWRAIVLDLTTLDPVSSSDDQSDTEPARAEPQRAEDALLEPARGIAVQLAHLGERLTRTKLLDGVRDGDRVVVAGLRALQPVSTDRGSEVLRLLNAERTGVERAESTVLEVVS